MSTQLRLRVVRIILAYLLGFTYIALEKPSIGVLVLILSGVILASSSLTVGGTLKTAYFFLKSVVFCFVACMVWLYLFKNQAMANFIGMSLVAWIGVYYFVDRSDFLVGFTLVALAPFFFINNGNVYTGTLAALDSVIGIVFVIIVLFLFHPQYARVELFKKIRGSLADLQNVITDLCSGKTEASTLVKHALCEENFLQSMGSFHNALDEIKIETHRHAEYISECSNLFLKLRRLYKLFYVLRDLFGEPSLAQEPYHLALQKIRDKLQKTLDMLDTIERTPPLLWHTLGHSLLWPRTTQR